MSPVSVPAPAPARTRNRANHPVDVFKFVDMKGGDITQCWLWTAGTAGRDHRPCFKLWNRKWIAYRIIWELFNGRQLDDDEVVRHTCDNKMCCNPHHLLNGTQRQNVEDMFDRERRGLTRYKLQQIRDALDLKIPQSFIATQFGISQQLASDINTRRVYQRVPWPSRDKGETNE